MENTFPLVVFAIAGNAPPRVIQTQEALDALDPKVWTTIPPQERDAETWPQVWYNVNVPPAVVRTAEDAAALGDAWRKLDVEIAVPAAE